MITHSFNRAYKSLEVLSEAQFELNFEDSDGRNLYPQATVMLHNNLSIGDELNIFNLSFYAADANILPNSFNRFNPALGLVQQLNASNLGAHYLFVWVDDTSFQIQGKSPRFDYPLQFSEAISGSALAQLTLDSLGDSKHSFFRETANSAFLQVRYASHTLHQLEPFSYAEKQIELSHLLRPENLQERFFIKELLASKLVVENKRIESLAEIQQSITEQQVSLPLPAFSVEIQLWNSSKDSFGNFLAFQQGDVQKWLLLNSPYPSVDEVFLRDENNEFEVPFINYLPNPDSLEIPYVEGNFQQQTPLVLEYLQLHALETVVDNSNEWKVVLNTFDAAGSLLQKAILFNISEAAKGWNRIAIAKSVLEAYISSSVSSFHLVIEDNGNRVLYAAPSFSVLRADADSEFKKVATILSRNEFGAIATIDIPLCYLEVTNKLVKLHSEYLPKRFLQSYELAIKELIAIAMPSEIKFQEVAIVDYQLEWIENNRLAKFIITLNRL